MTEVERAKIEGAVLVRHETPGSVSWDVAAASALINRAIQEAMLNIRHEIAPQPGGQIPLRVTVTVETEGK